MSQNSKNQFVTGIELTHQQYNTGDVGSRMDRLKKHDHIENRFSDKSVQKNVDTDCELIEHYNELIPKMEWFIKKNATHHNSKNYHLLKTVPGIGDVLALIILYEIHEIERFPRVQEFLSYSRLVKCSKESAGKRLGTGGSKIGNVHLKWAFSEAAILFIRGENERKKLYNKLINKHGKGKAISRIASKLGRTVYYMLKRENVFDERKFLN